MAFANRQLDQELRIANVRYLFSDSTAGTQKPIGFLAYEAMLGLG